MNPFDTLRGNEKLKSYFTAEIEKGTLPHALILEGDEGSGKHTLALAVAAAMAGAEHRERILAGQCPDVKEYGLAPEKKIITVDLVRKMKSDAAVLPNDLPFRFFIISDAQCMNRQAQNAALKILEEPPAATYFFLLCDSAATLLPTVRSRAPVIRMQRFSREELTAHLIQNGEYLRKKENDPLFFEECVALCAGSYGKACTLLLGKGVSEQKQKALELLEALSDGARAQLLLLAAKLPSARAEYDQILFYMQMAVRDLLLVRSAGEEGTLLFFPGRLQAQNTAKHLGSGQLLQVYDCLCIQREYLIKNVNMQNARMALARDLARAAV